MDLETRALEAARLSGLIAAGAPLLVMLSGGADSVCLLDVAVRLGARVAALHVNYGLRAEAGGDERHCRELCRRLDVPLTVEHVTLDGARGNLQARARSLRYALAERIAEADYAAAHTSSDQVETSMYRLASSPGGRALLGMRARRGRLVRPLLEATREETRAHCLAAALEWREDSSNADPRFARARVRHELLPALTRVSAGAERTVAETARILAAEAELLDELAERALGELGGEPSLPALRELPAALLRLVLLRLMPDGSSLSAVQIGGILALDERGGTATLDLGDGVRAVSEYGRLRFERAASPPRCPDEVTVAVPGRVRFGDWEIAVLRGRRGDGQRLRADAVRSAVVRGWRDGDRMRPVGLGGTKKLQDLFTDRKLPRDERRSVPILVVAGQVACIPGIAIDERFAAAPGEDAVAVTARRLPG